MANIKIPVTARNIAAVAQAVRAAAPESREIHVDGTSRFQDGRAAWGKFANLERVLHDLGIAFDRRSCGKYEYDPEIRMFRPGTVDKTLLTDASSDTVVHVRHLTAARDQGVAALVAAVSPPKQSVAAWGLANAARVAELAAADPAASGDWEEIGASLAPASVPCAQHTGRGRAPRIPTW